MTALARPANPGRKGVFWSSLNGVGSVVIPFAVFSAFAHILAPAELAQFGVALACAELLKSLGPMGLYDVLIAHDESEREVHRTAAAVFLAGALAVSAVFVLAIAGSGWLLNMRITPLVDLLVLKILFDYLLLQPQAVLVRRGEVRRLGVRGLAAGAVSGAAGLAVGFMVAPLLGFAIYYVLLSAMTLAMTAIGTGSAAMPAFSGGCFRALRRQAALASGTRFSGGLNSYLDQIVIGHSFAPLAVGMYNVGKRIEVSIITLASSLSQILWQPTFARVGPDERADEAGRAFASVALICGVPVLALLVTAKQSVPLLFGAHWADAAMVVGLLGLSGLARALNGVGGAVFTVTSRNGTLLGLSLMGAMTNVAIIVLSSRFGLEITVALVAARNFFHGLLTLSLLAELRARVPVLLFANFVLPLAVVLATMFGLQHIVAWLPQPPDGALRDLYQVAVIGGGGLAVGLLLLLKRI